MTMPSKISPEWALKKYTDINFIDNAAGLSFTQGLVWNPDAKEWIATWQFGLARASGDFKLIQVNGGFNLSTLSYTSGIAKELMAKGLNHIGDVDYYNGKIYVSLDNSDKDYRTGYVAIYNASDLTWTGKVYELVGSPANPHHDVASWIAVDGKAGLGYGKEWQMGDTINVYNLSDWSFSHTLKMDIAIKNVQGAKVHDGKLYMAADNETRSIYSVDLKTGHVTELFRLPDTKGEGHVTEGEGIGLFVDAEGKLHITVELIVKPDGKQSEYAYVRMFEYVLGGDAQAGAITPHHVWTVTTAGDSDNNLDFKLSLHEALKYAHSGDTITFAAGLAGSVISLADADMIIAKNIKIVGDLNGDGKADITIQSRDTTPFHVKSGNVVLEGVVLQNADGSAAKIIVDNGATLTFIDNKGATSDSDTLLGGNHQDVIHGGAGDDIIQGLAGNDKLYGGAGKDTIIAGQGDDTVDGGAGDDTLIGNEGNDHLLGGAGNDHLNGGAGNDMLEGGVGSDTYVYRAGDGSDTIIEGAAEGDQDQLRFDDAKRSDVVIRRHGSDIILEVGGETITLKDQLAGKGAGVEVISFADGTSLVGNQIAAAAVNRGPAVTSAATATGDEDTKISGQIIAKDVDGDALTYAIKNGFGVKHGTLAIDAATGKWTYIAKANYNGADGFTAVVSDGHGGFVEQRVALNVKPVNDAPIAVTSAATATGDEDTKISGQIIAKDVDGDALTYAIKNGFGVKHGTLAIDAATGKWTYIAKANYNGADGFTAVVSDGHGGFVEQRVTLNVKPINDAPIAVNDAATATGDEDTKISGQIMAKDVDGDALTYAIKNGFGVKHGTLAIDAATGKWTYIAKANYNGADGFTAVVSDGHGGFVEQRVTLNVKPVNDAPIAVNDAATVGESENKVFDLAANDTDVDGDALSLTGFSVTGVTGINLTADAVKAAFAIKDGKLSFTPGTLFDSLHKGETAKVTLSYTVNDGHADATGHVTLTINGEGTAANVMLGTATSDVMIGTDGDDAITAYAGGDYVFGRDGADVIDGGAGNDYLYGGKGKDVLNGGEGHDVLFGGAGNDVLIGGKGNDILTGGAGADSFVFRKGFGHDTVTDFAAHGTGADHDVINLSKSAFADFAAVQEHLTDTALGVTLTLGDGSTLTLSHVTKASLSADDFHFSA